MERARSQKPKPPRAAASRSVAVRRLDAGGSLARRDRVVVEEPLEIRVLGRPLAVVMRTPGEDLDLVAGFLVTEGIAPVEDLAALAPCVDARGKPQENIVNASLVEGASIDFEKLRRNLYASSSCGICGKATLDLVEVLAPRVVDGLRVSAALLRELPARARARQATFEETGGVHAACLFDGEGTPLLLREDVGRHNAVDKVVGARARAGEFPLSGTVLFVSGRGGFEIVQKARVAQVPVVAAVGAPSSLAIECAERGGMTLVGFLREGGFNVYCGEERILA